MFQSFALSVVLAAACAPACAQLIKCAGPDGRVTYSDRPCQADERRAEVKAAPLPEPTAREVREAELRSVTARIQAREIEQRRAAERPKQAIGITPERVRGRNAATVSLGSDVDRCFGARRQIRIAKRLNPIGYERDIATIELQRAERQFCGN